MVITLLTYVSLICGGLLVLILLIGIIGGLDFDFDLDFDTDADPGVGMGILKGGLTFLSIGSWVVKLMLLASSNPVAAIVTGLVAGAVAVWLLSLVLKLLLRQEENVNWSHEDTLMESGEVYLRIPPKGEGIVRVSVKGGVRELKARSFEEEAIPTGAKITVEDYDESGVLVVKPAAPPQ